MSQPRNAPRYVPARALPAYAFIPGRAPHPTSDPRGHSYGVTRAAAPALAITGWRDNADYLWGVDLYNHGYPWEAHEAWEGLWRQAERGSVVHAHLQGLIQCAAAVVKAMGEQPAGVASLSRSGLALLDDVVARAGSPHLGVDLVGFGRALRAWAAARPLQPDSWPLIELVGLADLAPAG